MKFNRLAALTAAASTSLLAPHVAMAQDWSFRDVSLNHLAWTQKTLNNTGKGPFAQKKDFNFLEIEGGLGGKWGDLYGFFDIENPTAGTHEAGVGDSRRFAWKVAGRVKMADLGGLPLQFYAHLYDFVEGDFNDQNRVVGLGTEWSSGSFWIKPFLGVHQESKTGVGAHVNGGMGGWVLGYSFKAMDQSMMITSWHETEFGRSAAYRGMARNGAAVTGSSTGQNGAVSLWWNATKSFTAGATYRYASHKLGSATYQDGLIFTAKLNF